MTRHTRGNTSARSDLELLWVEMTVLWDLDDRQRLHGPEAPVLVVAAASDGLTATVADHVPDDLAAQALDLVDRGSPSRPGQPPAVVQQCQRLLVAALPDPPTLEGGPSYLVSPSLPHTPPVPVLRSDRQHAHSVRRLRPSNWQPAGWDELINGGAGAPWAMVVQDDQVVSICHTPRRSPVGAEAGTWTDPAFRGRGYAAATTAAWAEVLSADSPHLFYSTSRDNRSSQRVAERLRLRPLGWLWKLTQLAGMPGT